MCFGAFDGLHPGHLNFFEQAKKYGDKLIVSVGTDKNVEKIKGKKPLFSQVERLALIDNCKIVDKAVIGAEDNYFENIASYEPDVICLGYDQWAREEDVKEGLRDVGLVSCKVVRLKPYEEKRAKSTIIKEESVDF
ncbi:MAG: FAD synthase [Candidatus Curtissbacteria bacterium GW2011_GWA1_41_11]|uniref:FAD synthase n=1 Tax=Candidatus Curtissbacteria bacterium GW2011_GWA1_41_11 TaxID=1618409 RepID=A0A0G0UG65_9BACT|nr:MAG: FAD synthase [Candidatus Curtissbacteria bacterium GW2011_GWA1_41_11]